MGSQPILSHSYVPKYNNERQYFVLLALCVVTNSCSIFWEFKLLEVGDNVRIPIPSVDRAPLGPTSLVGAVLGVSSTGNTLQLGTKYGRIASRFYHSEVSPCGSLLPPMSLMCSYPLDLRPGRRSCLPIPDAAIGRRASLDAATEIS